MPKRCPANKLKHSSSPILPKTLPGRTRNNSRNVIKRNLGPWAQVDETIDITALRWTVCGSHLAVGGSDAIVNLCPRREKNAPRVFASFKNCQMLSESHVSKSVPRPLNVRPRPCLHHAIVSLCPRTEPRSGLWKVAFYALNKKRRGVRKYILGRTDERLDRLGRSEDVWRGVFLLNFSTTLNVPTVFHTLPLGPRTQNGGTMRALPRSFAS